MGRISLYVKQWFWVMYLITLVAGVVNVVASRRMIDLALVFLIAILGMLRDISDETQG